MNIVLDTNVLVSALWSADSKPAAILNAAISRRFAICYDYRILEEYSNVLHRPKFNFQEWQVNWVLDELTKNGWAVVPDVLSDIEFTDESDRKFFEVAKFCQVPLVTGNIKHFPADPAVMTVANFYSEYLI